MYLIVVNLTNSEDYWEYDRHNLVTKKDDTNFDFRSILNNDNIVFKINITIHASPLEIQYVVIQSDACVVYKILHMNLYKLEGIFSKQN